jgi:hypothetical protein
MPWNSVTVVAEARTASAMRWLMATLSASYSGATTPFSPGRDPAAVERNVGASFIARSTTMPPALV